ncbi:MAG: hypothetical protein SCK29_09190, partial [Bacillota bacterium]|nr:hypothetical protein [Bacillota bacterium]
GFVRGISPYSCGVVRVEDPSKGRQTLKNKKDASEKKNASVSFLLLDNSQTNQPSSRLSNSIHKL